MSIIFDIFIVIVILAMIQPIVRLKMIEAARLRLVRATCRAISESSMSPSLD